MNFPKGVVPSGDQGGGRGDERCLRGSLRRCGGERFLSDRSRTFGGLECFG